MCWICDARPWLKLHAEPVKEDETPSDADLTSPTSPRPAESPPP